MKSTLGGYVSKLLLCFAVGGAVCEGGDSVETGGDQSPTFMRLLVLPTGLGPRDIVVADFNNDQQMDIAVSNNESGDISVFLAAMEPPFVHHAIAFPFLAPTALYAGLLTFEGNSGNTKRDPAVDLLVAAPATVGGYLILLQNCGDGTSFQEYTGPFGDGPWLIAEGSDTALILEPEDGTIDVAIIGASSFQNNVASRVSDGDGAYPGIDHDTTYGQLPVQMATGDLDGDELNDLVIVHADSGIVTILAYQEGQLSGGVCWKGKPFGGCPGVGTSPPDLRMAEPVAVVIAHLDEDEINDLAVVDATDDIVRIFLGMGDGTFIDAGSYAVASSPNRVGAGDIDGDGDTDLVVSSNGVEGSWVTALLSNGTGVFSNATPPFDVGIQSDITDLVVNEFLTVAASTQDLRTTAFVSNATDELVFLRFTGCPADLNANGMVGIIDFLITLADWSLVEVPADLFPPIGVGPEDLREIIDQWGACPGPSAAQAGDGPIEENRSSMNKPDPRYYELALLLMETVGPGFAESSKLGSR